jgi:hypothetical protein
MRRADLGITALLRVLGRELEGSLGQQVGTTTGWATRDHRASAAAAVPAFGSRYRIRSERRLQPTPHVLDFDAKATQRARRIGPRPKGRSHPQRNPPTHPDRHCLRRVRLAPPEQRCRPLLRAEQVRAQRVQVEAAGFLARGRSRAAKRRRSSLPMDVSPIPATTTRTASRLQLCTSTTALSEATVPITPSPSVMIVSSPERSAMWCACHECRSLREPIRALLLGGGRARRSRTDLRPGVPRREVNIRKARRAGAQDGTAAVRTTSETVSGALAAVVMADDVRRVPVAPPDGPMETPRADIDM